MFNRSTKFCTEMKKSIFAALMGLCLIAGTSVIAQTPQEAPVPKTPPTAEQIAQYQAQIRQIKGIRLCPECGAEVGPDSAFCGGCGARMEPSAPQGGRTCPKCGSPADGDSLFCAACGTRLE